jgi:hypothetical protein
MSDLTLNPGQTSGQTPVQICTSRGQGLCGVRSHLSQVPGQTSGQTSALDLSEVGVKPQVDAGSVARADVCPVSEQGLSVEIPRPRADKGNRFLYTESLRQKKPTRTFQKRKSVAVALRMKIHKDKRVPNPRTKSAEKWNRLQPRNQIHADTRSSFAAALDERATRNAIHNSPNKANAKTKAIPVGPVSNSKVVFRVLVGRVAFGGYGWWSPTFRPAWRDARCLSRRADGVRGDEVLDQHTQPWRNLTDDTHR